MGIEMSMEEQVCHARVEGEMTIYTVKSQRQALLEHCQQMAAKAVAVYSMDLSRVTEIDASGLQLLVAFLKHLERINGRLRLVNASACVQDVLAQTELSKRFPNADERGGR